jgi:hypothetical protein
VGPGTPPVRHPTYAMRVYAAHWLFCSSPNASLFFLQSFFSPNDLLWPYLLSAIDVTQYLFEFSFIFLPIISTQYRLRSFVRIIPLIRLFFMFFPNLLGRLDSPFFPHKFCCVWNFTIFLSAFPLHPIAANPTIDCLLHCYCQLNLLSIFFLLLSTVLHCPFSHPYRFATG